VNSDQSNMPEFPARSGPKPLTVIPAHQQLDQFAPAEIQQRLNDLSGQLDGVRIGTSLTPAPTGAALHIVGGRTHDEKNAYIIDTEFAHFHEDGSGSLHMTLPKRIGKEAITRGWAEAHPGAMQGYVPETLVMVFGPRDDEELAVVWQLLRCSHEFAIGAHPPTA
jgi:hypothetical protein